MTYTMHIETREGVTQHPFHLGTDLRIARAFALEALRREYNNGEPERKGEERNSQKYADRVAEMKAAIQRKEADLAAIRREMGKLGQ